MQQTKMFAGWGLLLAAMILTLPVHAAQPGEALARTLTEIRQNQGLGPDDPIQCDRVTDQQLETLGQAVVETNQPNAGQRQRWMQIMGGQGTANLAATYRMIGAQYLGCVGESAWNGPHGGGGMMGPGYGGWMMGPGYGHGWMMGPGYGMMGYGHGYGWGHAWGWWSWLFWIVVIVIFALIIAAVVRGSRGRTGREGGALEILKLRYARGEISREDYERMKKELS